MNFKMNGRIGRMLEEVYSDHYFEEYFGTDIVENYRLA